ncbi:hypothetical protein ACVITL_006896 [Rhizobium pisi]
MADDNRPQLANLISRHHLLVVLLAPSIREEPLRKDKLAGWGELSSEERRLRADIIAWSPRNAAEARQKLEYLARFIVATGVSFDADTHRVILESVAPFFG